MRVLSVCDEEFGVVELWLYAFLFSVVAIGFLWFSMVVLIGAVESSVCKDKLAGFVFLLVLVSLYFGVVLSFHTISTSRLVLKAQLTDKNNEVTLTLGYGNHLRLRVGDVSMVTPCKNHLYAQARLPLGRGGWYSALKLVKGKTLYISHAMLGSEILIEQLEDMIRGGKSA